MEDAVEVFTRDQVEAWLKSKRIILWADWCIGDPKQREKAVDWFINSVNECAATATH